MIDQIEQSKPSHPIDVHVGLQVRLRRCEIGITQSKLAASLGLTFQQIQKYERGANRIGASKLYEIAKCLDVPISWFFEGLSDPMAACVEGHVEKPFAHSLLSIMEGVDLANLFPKLKDRKVRRRVVDLVRAMVEDESEDQSEAVAFSTNG
jgi:transcriptional regulator with XRE-family HTH domain